MCHLTSLTPEQKRIFRAMNEVYQAALAKEIEALPTYADEVREFFDRWAARMQAVDNARRVCEITQDAVTEALEDYLPPSQIEYRRQDIAAVRAHWRTYRLAQQPPPFATVR